jgi:thioredoxin reductase (NADPH)
VGRPVLLSVDDDPGVSRAVARDLRRRYGEDHRVLRATSGAEALDALRELKLRGEPVAVLLADYRMPGMDGVEFLEQAMDLVPRARRCLLTAYADTDAAIRAINDVDVDAYLLKPWDPPEEKLYPTVDAMLKAWKDSPDPAIEEVKIVGHRWSAPSFAARDFLARNAVPYRWFSADEPEGRRLLEAAGATADDVPVVITPDAQVLRSPGEAELAAVVGLSVEPAADFYDLVVVGGGPAGLGAAVYGASEGLKTVLVERQATGGQAGQSSRIENYLGFPHGLSGAELAQRARDQAVRFGVEVLTASEVTAITPNGDGRALSFADGSQVTAHAVVLATGVSWTRLPAEGADTFAGRGVYYGAAAHEAADCQGPEV